MSGVYVVRDVVRDVIAVVAADEVAIVDALARYDDDTALRRLCDGGRDDLLGFGVDELAVLASPVVWLALSEMAKQVGTLAADGAVKGVGGLARKILRRRSVPTVIPALTREQLGQLRHTIIKLSTQRGLEPERAQAIADAVIARLAADSEDSSQKPSDLGNDVPR